MIVGFTGKECAGKTEAVTYVTTLGFKPISLSDYMRAEVRRRENLGPKDEIPTPVLVRVANELRQANAPDYLARLALEEIARSKSVDHVIDSIRVGAEAELLKRNGLYLIGVDVNDETRWQRHQQRQGRSKHPDMAAFLAADFAQMSPDPAKQQLHLVWKMRDDTVYNNTTKEDFYSQIMGLIMRRLR